MDSTNPTNYFYLRNLGLVHKDIINGYTSLCAAYIFGNVSRYSSNKTKIAFLGLEIASIYTSAFFHGRYMFNSYKYGRPHVIYNDK